MRRFYTGSTTVFRKFGAALLGAGSCLAAVRCDHYSDFGNTTNP
jgi:hypothetical protein